MELNLARTRVRPSIPFDVYEPVVPSAGDPLACLVVAVARGDEVALRGLYERTSPRVYGLALQILRDADAAEETVVDVYAQVWRQAARFDPTKGSVATWITTLARTRAIDLRRARGRRRDREVELGSLGDDTLREPAPGPVQHTQDGERAELVRAALVKLPAEQRRAVEAAFFSGLSHSEVARALDQPLGTVKTRIRSGLAALRHALAALEGDGSA